MKNITITMDGVVADWVRIEAAKRNTSISRMLGEMLAEKMLHTDAYQRAAHDWASKDRTWSSHGQPYGNRDHLVERSA